MQHIQTINYWQTSLRIRNIWTSAYEQVSIGVWSVICCRRGWTVTLQFSHKLTFSLVSSFSGSCCFDPVLHGDLLSLISWEAQFPKTQRFFPISCFVRHLLPVVPEVSVSPSVHVKLWFHIYYIHCSVTSSYSWVGRPSSISEGSLVHQLGKSSQHPLKQTQFFIQNCPRWLNLQKLNILVPVSGPKLSGSCCRKETC